MGKSAEPENGEPKAKIFISYSRKDMAFADRIDAALTARGFEPLIDRTEIYAFEDWWQRIEALIGQADTVVFIISPDAVASEVTLKEVARAASLNKRFAPIVIRRTADASIPGELRRRNFIFFDDQQQFEARVDQLAEALRTNIGWIRRHTEFGEAARQWSDVGRPNGLLLRSPALEEAERWIATRPRGAPAPTADTQAFIAQSRRGATRRRNVLTGSLAAGLLLALALAGLAYAERENATAERDLAEHNASEAKAEKERADQSAAAAERNAADARAQRDIAERETAEANRQAALSDARAQLNQSQLITGDAPREALSRAVQAAQKLDALGADEQAFAGLRSVANAVREVPLRPPYSHYVLTDATVIARQSVQDDWRKSMIGGRSVTRPLTVIGTYDLTGIVDDDGRAVGRPIASGEVDRSYANDAVWLDDDSFILATGAWSKVNGPAEPFSLFNPALRRFRADGNLGEEYLAQHTAPITSVAVLKGNEKQVILAGDALGNLIVKPVVGELKIIPTGVVAPIKRIVTDSASSNIVVLFGRSTAAAPSGPIRTAPAAPDRALHLDHFTSTDDSPPIPEAQKNFNITDQLTKIVSALELPVTVSYLGNNPGDDIGCAIVVQYDVFVCNRNTIDAWRFKPEGGLQDKPEYSFPTQNASVTALAASPVSPIIAAGYGDGKIRLWLTNRTLLADLVRDEKTNRVKDAGGAIGALGFVQSGRRLMSSSLGQVNIWDTGDLSAQFRDEPSPGGAHWVIRYRKRLNWVDFYDEAVAPSGAPVSERLMALIKESEQDGTDWIPHRRFLIVAHSANLRLIDTQSLAVHDLHFPGHRQVTQDSASGSLREDRKVATGAGSTICIVYGVQDKNFDDRRLYAIDEESGSVLADWSWPADLKDGEVVLATHRIRDETTCWAAVGRVIAIFSPRSGSLREIAIDGLNSKQGESISHLEPVDGSDFFAIAGTQGATSSVVLLARLEATAEGSGGANPDTSTAVSILASKKLNASIKGMALNPAKSLIAVALNDNGIANYGSNDANEVKLFDWNFSTIISLPGSEGAFRELNFRSDGKVLRGTSWGGMNYEQDLRLQPLLDHAQGRLDAWADDDDRAALYTKAAGEKDWEEAKLILQDAAVRHPVDPQITLLLANRAFYTARSFEDRKSAFALYDKAYALDPFEPIIYYMRGRARAVLADNRGAIEDFTGAIGLPHILPAVKVIAGFLGLNRGIAKLSTQLNLQAKAELYLRRAAARTAIGEWQGVLEDVTWVREKSQLSAHAHELAATAWDNLGNYSAATTSYQQAAATLKDAKSYGPFEEFNDSIKDTGWRNFKIALYDRRMADIYRRFGRNEEAAAADASAQKVIEAAYALPGLTAQARARLDQLSDQQPNARCENESRYKSIDSNQAVSIAFINKYTSSVRVYWLDYAGQRNLYANVNSGGSYNVLTAMTHPWLIADSSDKCMAIYLGGAQPAQITLQKVRLGIIMAELSTEAASTSQENVGQGAVVKEIIPQSPAMDAGLKPGDLIVGINDSFIKSVNDALGAVQASGPVMIIHVVREGTELELKAVLGN